MDFLGKGIDKRMKEKVGNGQVEKKAILCLETE